MSTNHGNWLRTLQNGRHLYCTEDFAGRHGTQLYLPDVREILCRGHSAVEYGESTGRAAEFEVAEARNSMLSASK